MKEPNYVQDIVIEYLKTHGYDGLYNNCLECACLLDDLMPCSGDGVIKCQPGNKQEPPPNQEDDFSFAGGYIGPTKNAGPRKLVNPEREVKRDNWDKGK